MKFWFPKSGSVKQWGRFVADCRMQSVSDSAKTLVNKTTFVARRTLGRLGILRFDETSNWLDKPFSLRGRVAWSPAARAWYVLEDEGTPLAMAETRDEPQEWMLSALSAGMVVIDVGAHQGRYAIRFSRKVGADGLVVSVEPNARNLAVLTRNLELNRIRNTRTVHAACWSRREYLQLMPGSTLDTSRVSLTAEQRGDVEGLPLDELVASLGLQRVDLLKIDVEGAEIEVLEGAKSLLEKFQPRVFLEFHGTLSDAKQWFRDHDYRVERKQDDLWTTGYGWIWVVPGRRAVVERVAELKEAS